jgi:hypothetical protein
LTSAGSTSEMGGEISLLMILGSRESILAVVACLSSASSVEVLEPGPSNIGFGVCLGLGGASCLIVTCSSVRQQVLTRFDGRIVLPDTRRWNR